MTPEEKLSLAQKYVINNPDPDQVSCPELIQYWRNKNGLVYWSNRTGKRTYNYTGCRSVSVKSEYYSTYIKYISKIDALEVSFIEIKGNRGVDGEKKYWKFNNRYYDCGRYFIFHNDVNVYVIYKNGKGVIKETKQKYYNKEMSYRLGGSPDVCDMEIIMNEIHKFDSDYDFQYPYFWHVKEWYEKYFIRRNKSKVMNDLLSFEFDDISQMLDFDNKALYYYNYKSYFQIADENYAVLRVFQKYNNNEIKETHRIFISKSGKPTIVEHEYNNEWRVKPQFPNYGHVEIQNIEDIKEWKPLKYISSCVEDNDNQINMVVSILRHPIIEKLIKCGYVNIAKIISAHNKIPSNLKEYFKVYKETNKSLYKELGVNKYLLDKYEECLSENRYCYSHPIRQIKNLYGGGDISGLSKETLDMLFNAVKDNSNTVNMVLSNSGYYYYNENVEITDEEKRNFFLKLCKINEKSQSDVVRTYIDVKRLANNITTMPDIDINNFHNEAELIRIHDAIVNIHNLEMEERRARYDEYEKKRLKAREEKFNKLQKERIKKYEKDGEKYCIRMPKSLAEIVTEGTVLNHCVGGYAGSHAEGTTNIIFLREKERETIPFYTIEIRDDRVIQIHGKHNRWLGNNPDAIPFVYEWLNDLGVKFDNKLLLNKGAGYSPSSENLPTSYLYDS